ncbi:hypothetical protein VU04_03900 [Desulfobulbus sp. TB]|nr:hypothetical protein [Desulfobulbus sp. TB]
MTFRFTALSFFALFCCLPQAYGHELPEGALPLQKSEKCAGCHPTIYQEWKSSFHALSSIHKDNAHKAVYQSFIKDMNALGKKGNYHCGNCHAPMADNLKELMSGDVLPDSGNWTETEGVGCTFCHRIEAVVEKKIFNMYRLNGDGTYYSGWSTFGNAPHATKQSALFRSGQVCMGCHSHNINGKGAKICMMKEEGQSDCLTCHMQPITGAPAVGSTATTHRSHLMAGGHDIDTLKKAVSLKARIKTVGNSRSLVINVTNKILHSFPSTSPIRMAFVKVSAKDETGEIVWENFTKSPLEDKNALFFKAFKAGDKVGVAPWAAEEVAFDLRLKAGETRTITYPVVSDEITQIDVKLVYLLFPPAAIQKFGIPKDGVNDKLYPIARKTVSEDSCREQRDIQITLNIKYFVESSDCKE